MFWCLWYYGLIVFKEHYNKYEISFEFNRYELKVPEILFDFMEIKGKENAFILCGWEHAYIINDKKIMNKITFDEFDLKNILNNNYICQFKDNLFVISGIRYITLIKTNENKFKQIKLLEECKTGTPTVYKYNLNSIILLCGEDIFIIQIIDDERIQLNIHIKFGNNNCYHYLKFINEENSIYFRKSFMTKEIYKLQFKKKL